MATEEVILIQNPRGVGGGGANKMPKLDQDKRLGWESLPRDLLLKIYEKLPTEDLAVGSPLACRHWYAASLDPSLYRVLDLRSGGAFLMKKKQVSPGDVLKIVVPRGRGMVKCVRFPDHGMWDSDCFFVADRCPDIKFVSMSKHTSDRAFCYVVKKWKDLEGMEVHGCSLNSRTLNEIRSSCKKFVSLSVYGELSRKTASCIRHHLPKLKSVNLSAADFCDYVMTVILPAFKELESLDPGCGRFAAGLEKLKEFNTRLKSLHFHEGSWGKKLNVLQFLML